MKMVGVLLASHRKSLGARTSSLHQASSSQSASVHSELWVHSDAVCVSGGGHSLPARVLRYSVIQLGVQVGQWHVVLVVTHLGAGAILLDADGLIVLVGWVESSDLAPDWNLDSGVMRVRRLWRLSLVVSPRAEPIFERLELGTIQRVIQSVEVLETFVSLIFSGRTSDTFAVRWAISLPRLLLSKDRSSFRLLALLHLALLVLLLEVNCKRIILT